MQSKSHLSKYSQAAARRKLVLSATLFFLAFTPCSHKIKSFSFTGQVYARESQNVKIIKPDGEKQRIKTDDSVESSSSPITPSRNGTKIRISRLNQSKICLLPAEITEQENPQKFLNFKDCLSSFKENAIKKGVSSDAVHAAFKKVHFIDQVVQLDRKQNEYTRSFTNYINDSISISRIQRGKRKLKEYAKTLHKIQDKYGIPPEILVSLWGLESDFGSFTGKFSTMNTLATLACEGRRREFFTNELLCALTMLDSEKITVDDMTGSWAGAMGQPQFMPSTFHYYAVDGNGDGKKNIWQNTSDVFASAANYLYKLKWKREEPWGVEVVLPENFDPYQAKLSLEKSLEQWRASGVKKPGGKELKGTALKGSILLPAGRSGPAFLVFHNFHVIREWNKSVNYALAAGHLADRIAGGAPLTRLNKKRDKDLSRQDAFMIQSTLASLEYYKDEIDGMVGIKSREAIREYQKEKGMPADGYPSDELILKLRGERL